MDGRGGSSPDLGVGGSDRSEKCFTFFIFILHLSLKIRGLYRVYTVQYGHRTYTHLLLVSTPLYIWMSRSLSRAALCSGSGTPTSLAISGCQQYLSKNRFTLMQLLEFAKFNVMLNKAPLDLSCHSTDVS